MWLYCKGPVVCPAALPDPGPHGHAAPGGLREIRQRLK